jgi:hypothetical protein
MEAIDSSEFSITSMKIFLKQIVNYIEQVPAKPGGTLTLFQGTMLVRVPRKELIHITKLITHFSWKKYPTNLLLAYAIPKASLSMILRTPSVDKETIGGKRRVESQNNIQPRAYKNVNPSLTALMKAGS